MSIEEKYKAIDWQSFVFYGVEGLCADEEDLMRDYLSIRQYESEIRKDYEANREAIEAVASKRHHSPYELDRNSWFLNGAYMLCEHFKMIRDSKQLEAEVMNGSAVSSAELSRHINEEELKKYFTPNFKGGNNWNSHNFFEMDLLPDLRKNRSDKDMARIALLIYNSKAIDKQKKPTTFKKWCETFANLIGFKTHGYKQNQLEKGIDKLEKELYYLKSYSRSSL